MSAPLELGIAGIGAWAPGANDWPHLAVILRGAADYVDSSTARPTAACLPMAERRRAPDGVRLAVEVATQAAAMAGVDTAHMPCVFASTYGESGLTDGVCTTLARAPRELSPTKFHNSVLNAAAGYWTIATGCTAPSSAVSAAPAFAAGLLEAAALTASERTPTLYACCDVAATGALASMIPATRAFGAALVIAPTNSRGIQLRLGIEPTRAPSAIAAESLPAIARDNPASVPALALLAVLAHAQPAQLDLPLSAGLQLHMEIQP